MIELSISDDLTYNFKSHIIPFVSVGEYIRKYCYSSCAYSNGHRHKNNLKSLGNVLIYDFDDGSIPLLSMKQFMERNKITSAIFTTKSHQKEKNGKEAVDRYRLFIPFSAQFTLDIEKYSEFYMYIAEILNIHKAIDTACKNPSRSFYPNANQIEIYIEQGRIFDTDYMQSQFSKYDAKHNRQVKKEIKDNTYSKDQTYSSTKSYKENEVSPDTEIECAHGVIYPLSHFEYLSENETVPCRCINPAHVDKNPSAFVSRSSNSHSLMVKCSSCGALYFMHV